MATPTLGWAKLWATSTLRQLSLGHAHVRVGGGGA